MQHVKIPRLQDGALFEPGDYKILKEAIERLGVRQRTILEMHFWNHLSMTEIAEILRTDWASVMSDMGQALRTLRRLCIDNPEFSRTRYMKASA